MSFEVGFLGSYQKFLLLPNLFTCFKEVMDYSQENPEKLFGDVCNVLLAHQRS